MRGNEMEFEENNKGLRILSIDSIVDQNMSSENGD
jgi:hypothetical protein